MSANNYQKSLIRENSSAVAYAPLAFTAGEYVPNDNMLFSGLYVAPGTSVGAITLEGVDGVARTISIGPGVWPFGGAKILETGTTISTAAVTVLF
jgi:hypothetical protein